MTYKNTRLFHIFDVDRNTRKKWEFTLAVVRTLVNVAAFWIQLLTLYFVFNRS